MKLNLLKSLNDIVRFVPLYVFVIEIREKIEDKLFIQQIFQ